MGNSIFGIGVGALTTAQAGLATTGHNISNVNTPGYHRQQIVQNTNIPQFTGIGFLGQGVHVDTVKRLYDQTLDGQVMLAETQASHLESFYAQVKQIDNMLADPNAGLSPALQDFFNGVHDVAANPASIPSRQAMISSAEAMVSRFQAIDQRFREIRDGVNSEIRSSVGVINSYAQQIASLNRQVTLAQSSSGQQQPPNDLLDQRDQLIAELNKVVKVTTLQQDDGSYNVFIGNGQTLVIGQQSFTLAATPSLDDPEQLEVGVTIPGGGVVLLGKGSLTGGTLGGVLAFRSETLDSAQNALGRVAIGMAQTFNDQHHLGMDLNGTLGGNFFDLAAPKVIPNTNNPAGASVSATFSDVGALTTDDYRLSYDGAGNWSMLNLMSNRIVTMSGAGTVANPFIVDGLSIVATPPPAGSASFLIKPTVDGARDIGVDLTDTARIAAAAPIRTDEALGNAGSGRISDGTVNSFNNRVTVSFTSPTAFDVVDVTTGATLATNVAYTSGGSISFNGWNVAVTNGSGAPAAGDVFTIDNMIASTNSTTATIGTPALNSPSPVDPFLSNSVRVVFDTPASTYHLEGLTNNITGTSTITGGASLPTQGRVVGSAPAGLTITAGTNDQLAVTVDGISATITIPPGSPYASANALAAAVQNAINTNPTISAAGKSVAVTADGAGVMTIASASYGSSSAVAVTGGNGRTNLLGAAPVTTQGANPVGTATGVATVGTVGNAGYYTSAVTKTTISGGTVTGTGPFTLTGATITVEGNGGYSTTFSGSDLVVSIAAPGGDISISASGPNVTMSTFHGSPATGLTYQPNSFNSLSVNGWTVQLSGTPAPGDAFLVGANTGGVSDNRNALLLAGLQTQNTLASRTASYQGAYSQLVSSVGNKTREVEVTAKAQANLVAQTQQAQQSMSGVNLDEEAANLLRYQQAYQAAGKMMQIATTLFDTLLSLGQ